MKSHHFHLPAYKQYKAASSKMQSVGFSAFSYTALQKQNTLVMLTRVEKSERINTQHKQTEKYASSKTISVCFTDN